MTPDTDQLRPARGLAYGLMLAIPVWCVILLLASGVFHAR